MNELQRGVKRLEEAIGRLAQSLRDLRDNIDVVMCFGFLAVILFALGIYLGALITVRHMEKRETLNSACLEQMGELNEVALGLYEDTVVANELRKEEISSGGFKGP